MNLYSEEELTGQLGTLSDAEPRAEFVIALEETLVREARKMKQKRHLVKWTAFGSGIVASVVLAVGLMSSGGQEILKSAIGGIEQHAKTQKPDEMGGFTLPHVQVTANAELVYTEYDGKDYWLCIVDGQTLKVKKKVFLTHGGHGMKVYRDPKGNFWCPMSVTVDGQTFYEVARYDLSSGKVSHAPLSGAVNDMFFTEAGTIIAGIGADNKPQTYKIDENMQTQGGWGIGATGNERPIFDGTYIYYYLTEGATLNQSGIKPGYFRFRPGSTSMESGILSNTELVPNIVFQGDKGQLFLHLTDSPGQFEEYDGQLEQHRKLTWDDVQIESHQLVLLEPNQMKLGEREYSILSVQDGGGGHGSTKFTVVDSMSGAVVESFETDFLANVSYANGKFFAMGLVEQKMAVFSIDGKLEKEANTTGMRSNVIVK